MPDQLTNTLLVLSIIVLCALGCSIPGSSNSKIVRSGCVTPDGSKIALNGFGDNARRYSRSGSDAYRLILDGETGKVVWKDVETGFPLVCGPDNSVITVSNTGAKWIESGKEIKFSKTGEVQNTDFIGMLDANTIVREERQYYTENMKQPGRPPVSSSTKSFSTFPTILIDRLDGDGTKSVTFSDPDADGSVKASFFNYYFEKNKIFIQAGKRLFAYNAASGTTQPISETYKDLQNNWVKTDKYDAVETHRETNDGVIEIFEGKGDNAKLVRQIKKSDLNAKVISIIDCCNNGLIVLYWERETYVKVAKIDHLSGEVIWKSDALNSEYVK